MSPRSRPDNHIVGTPVRLLRTKFSLILTHFVFNILKYIGCSFFLRPPQTHYQNTDWEGRSWMLQKLWGQTCDIDDSRPTFG